MSALLVVLTIVFGAEAQEVSTAWHRVEASDSGRVVATSGLFPVWENTGVLLGPSHVYLGTSQLAAALGSRVQLGLNPLRFAFRTPNLGVKVGLASTERVQVALTSEVLWLMPGSSEVFSTSNFSTRVDTSQHSMTAVPLAVSATAALSPKVFLHATVTELFWGTSNEAGVQATSGISAVLEWRPLLHHALSAHLTEVGFWRHDFFQFGASYRYQRSIFEARLGVGYQLRADGARVVPAASVGVEL